MRQAGLVGLFALVLASKAGLAQAQTPSSYVRAALDRLDAVVDGASYNSNLSFDVGRVTAGQQFSRSIVPATSKSVQVVAACDTDCSRIQLRVVDFQNHQVAYEQLHAGARADIRSASGPDLPGLCTANGLQRVLLLRRRWRLAIASTS
jgi:hypothetical protein